MSSEMISIDNVIDQSYELMLSLIRRAGVMAMEGFHSNELNVKYKNGDESDVSTRYDEEIERMLMDEIKLKFPNHKFLAEESSNAMIVTNEPTWIIDPIDGTLNFVKKNPFFGISIGFAVSKELQFGGIYLPIFDELYTARKGQGSFMNGNRIHCSNITQTSKGLLEHTIWDNDKKFKRFNYVSRHFMGLRNFGCAVMGLCYLARGFIDSYIGDELKAWDFAAGVIIATEAGAKITLDDGSPFNLAERSIIGSCTDEIHRETVRLVREADQNPLNIA